MYEILTLFSFLGIKRIFYGTLYICFKHNPVRMVAMTEIISYFLRGVGRLFYIVSPKATTFGHYQEVPDYIAESIPFFVLTIVLEFLALVFRHGGKGLRKERLWDASRYSVNDMVGSIGVSEKKKKVLFINNL